MKRTKRLSPYSQSDIWERDELLTIIKYEPSRRNKAALALFWDLDARNHEVTLLKIKNIRLREKYGEGEVPHDAKTGCCHDMISRSKRQLQRVVKRFREEGITGLRFKSRRPSKVLNKTPVEIEERGLSK